jgi:hypothetical protein
MSVISVRNLFNQTGANAKNTRERATHAHQSSDSDRRELRLGLSRNNLFSFLYLFFGCLFFGVHYKGNFFLALLFLLLTTVVLSSSTKSIHRLHGTFSV